MTNELQPWQRRIMDWLLDPNATISLDWRRGRHGRIVDLPASPPAKINGAKATFVIIDELDDDGA